MNSTSSTPNPLAFIVDDEPMLLDMNEEVMKSIGFEVRRFRTAEQALEAYRTGTTLPAIIVTDYSMHRMTGMDLLGACRALHPDQKVLLVSGTVGETIFQNSPMKPDGFIPKPYAVDELTAVVRELTGM